MNTMRAKHEWRHELAAVLTASLLIAASGLRIPERRLNIAGFVRNAFNTIQVLSVGSGPIQSGNGATSAPLSAGYRNISLSPLREIGVSANVNF